jgi:uncharacterized membrane protein YhaH (DUF805 family)
MEWMLLPLKRYAVFSGRSRRKEFWMYILFIVIVSVVLSIIDAALGLGGKTYTSTATPGGPNAFGAGFSAGSRGGLLANLFSLATLIPSLAVSVRRLHDVDKSGWWILLPLGPYLIGAVMLFSAIFAGGGSASGGLAVIGGLIMLVGFGCAILLLVWYCKQGTPGPNRFGPDPLGVAGDELARRFE